MWPLAQNAAPIATERVTVVPTDQVGRWADATDDEEGDSNDGGDDLLMEKGAFSWSPALEVTGEVEVNLVGRTAHILFRIAGILQKGSKFIAQDESPGFLGENKPSLESCWI
ncbi:hypothetical protein NE237_003980 [Protea cynaroides]|uniref:Uncharacterized protein n=1 Tax=Protea cynaroides TaxID=273540 RepID=A0A9Q0KII3_9MAGN|nr:hypothetical protein NE237_003980 [Protea cynaroides]